MKRTPLKRKGKSDLAKTKDRIQALLRLRAIERDGGCVMRHYPRSGSCGGTKGDGSLILQAEHLNNRQHSVSYGDMDNIVCICMAHHLFFKKREPALYFMLIRQHIGPQRWKKVEHWLNDSSPHRMTLYDWQQIEKKLTK